MPIFTRFTLLSQPKEVSVSCSVVSDSLQPHGPQPTGSSVHRSVETLELLYIAAGYVKNHTGAVENSLAVTCFEHSYYMIQKINP